MEKYNLKTVFDFLIELRSNNDREWFNENRNAYKEAKSEYEKFINQLIPEIKKLDKGVDVKTAKDCMFRIFKDVRFSKSKLPYKTNFGAVLAHGGRKSPFAGYYIHFEPDNSFLGGGIYMPRPEFLKSIRTSIFHNADDFKSIINSKKFKETFGEMMGDKLKTAPRGFPKDFKDIDLLNHKHFAVGHNVENNFWFKEDLVEHIVSVFKIQYDFNQFLNRSVQISLLEADKSKENKKSEEDFIRENFSL